jgi:hypothetical protein
VILASLLAVNTLMKTDRTVVVQSPAYDTLILDQPFRTRTREHQQGQIQFMTFSFGEEL